MFTRKDVFLAPFCKAGSSSIKPLFQERFFIIFNQKHFRKLKQILQSSEKFGCQHLKRRNMDRSIQKHDRHHMAHWSILL